MSDSFSIFVPGRIEVLGKHTDYAGGRSLTCAIDRGFRATVQPRGDAVLRIVPQDRAPVEMAISADLAPRPGHWSDYPRTVVRRMAANFSAPWVGAQVDFTSDLPPAAGLSSSSALVTLTWLALATCNRLAQREEYERAIRGREELADYLGCVEGGRPYGSLDGEPGVGTEGGSQDHVAILCARPGQLRQYRYRPVQFERAVTLAADLTFAVASSGVAAAKTGAARERFNRLSRATAEAAALYRRATGSRAPNLGAILAADPGAERDLLALLAAQPGERSSIRWQVERCAAFCEESEHIVPQAGEALAHGDLEAFGKWVRRSQQLAELLLRNQTAETIRLAAGARRLGAHAASAFGGGFGGSVWALIDSRRREEFLAAWRRDYLRRFPHHGSSACFFATGAAPPAAIHYNPP